MTLRRYSVKIAGQLQATEGAGARRQLLRGAVGRLADCCRAKCGWEREKGRKGQLTEVDDPVRPELGLAWTWTWVLTLALDLTKRFVHREGEQLGCVTEVWSYMCCERCCCIGIQGNPMYNRQCVRDARVGLAFQIHAGSSCLFCALAVWQISDRTLGAWLPCPTRLSTTRMRQLSRQFIGRWCVFPGEGGLRASIAGDRPGRWRRQH